MAVFQSPFQFGTLATEENFIDRTEDRALLKQLLASHINVMLISPRRWGKSSLVKKAMTELSEEDKEVRICYIDAFSIGSEAEFYRTFASQVIACASSKIERWIEDAKKFLTGVVPQIIVNDQITDFVAFDLKFVPQERDKMAILQLPELLAKEKGIRIIVCIDEFQQLANLPEYKDMEGKMRSVWQQQQLTSYCLYGSKRNSSLGLKQVLNINTPMFQNDTENLSSTQIELLKAIADGEQHFSSQAVKQVYNLGNPNTIVKNKKILQNKDIIEKQKADFVFVDPIYRLWFKEEYC